MKVRVSFAVLLYVVLANVPFWIASHAMGLLAGGLFNMEVIVIGILSVFLRRAVAVTLLLVAMLMDVLRGVNSTYLLSPSEMIRSARFLFEYAPAHPGGVVAVAICTALVCLMAALVGDGRSAGSERVYVVATLTVFAVLCWTVDLFAGRTAMLREDRELGAVRLTRLPTHSLVMSELRYETFYRTHLAGKNASAPAASKLIVRLDNAAYSASTVVPNVVLILVESWGKPVAADLEESLVRPYSDKELGGKYTVEEGAVPFYGPTVAGEARELCGSAMGFGLLSASATELKTCLPETMNAMGYHSTAVHGYSGRMFDREQWYRRIGFADTWFRDRLQGDGLPLCPGPFPGICDAAASEWIGDRLQRDADAPQFIYWVTLNSHLPVPVSNGVKAPPACSDNSSAAKDPAICAWYQLVFNVHRSVSQLALRATTRPTIFLVVGDHAPPFSSARLRSEFSGRVVPYFLLMPKGEGTKEGPGATGSFAVAAHRPERARKFHGKKCAAGSSAAVGG
jgi:hypothetical protein